METPLENLGQMESLLVRLIGLPEVLETSRKAERAQASETIERVLGTYGRLVHRQHYVEPDPTIFPDPYRQAIDSGNTRRASAIALEHLRTIRYHQTLAWRLDF